MKNKDSKSVDVIRGIVGAQFSKDVTSLCVSTPQHFFSIKDIYRIEELKPDDKVIGVVLTDYLFNICFDIRLLNGEKAFGYFIKNDINDKCKFQLINSFNKFSYDPFKPEYKLGGTIYFGSDEIKEAIYNWKAMFYSVF